MEDVPWLPLAMVVIAFLSWLRNRIKEAGEIRRARRAARAEAARARRTTEPAQPAYESPYRDQPAPELVEEIPKTFRELFDEINAQREIASAATPPPLPPQPVREEEPDDEIEPWGDGDGFGIPEALPPLKVAPRKQRSSHSKSKKHSLARTLSDGNQLRNALILKEILGPPKALRNHPRRTQL